MTDGAELLSQLWTGTGTGTGGDAAALGAVRLTGAGNGLPSSFRVGALGQATIAASALAAREIFAMRGGAPGAVEVPLDAAMLAFLSERHVTVDGGPLPDVWDPIAGNYPCAGGHAGGGWIRLHTNFPHHRDGVLDLLGCANERAAVAAALAERDGAEFEAAATARGMCVALYRTAEEWAAHPQSAAVAELPAVAIERIGDAPPEPFAPASRALEGVRVLDLTRIIAGPVAGRELASHGAEVLLVTAPHLPTIEVLAVDMGRGKRATHLDLRDAGQAETFRGLLAGADVLLQGYRPGAIARHGFGPAEAASVRPGIVYASLSAYGETGPWAGKRGFDSLVQMVTGIDHDEAAAAGEAKPRPLPCQGLDHGAGYLLALGIQQALIRRAREGGSWHVRVSLARTAQLLRKLGRVEGGLATPLPDPEPHLAARDTPLGRVRAVEPAARIERAMPHLDRPPVALGTHAPEWEDREA